MDSVIIAMAKEMPEEFLLAKLKKDLDTYMSSKTESNKTSLSMSLFLLTTRFATEKKTTSEVKQEIEKQREAADLYGRITGE